MTSVAAPAAASTWQQVLQNAVDNRNRSGNATVLLLGDVASGKSTLIHSLQKQSTMGSRRVAAPLAFKDTGGAAITNVACLPLQKLGDEELGQNLRSCAIFVQQKPLPQEFFKTLVVERWVAGGLSSAVIVVTVSATQLLAAYDRARVWLEFVAELIPSLIQQAAEAPGNTSAVEEFRKLREKKTALIKEVSDDELDDDIINVGFPMLLCVCKAENLQAQEFHPDRVADEALFTCHMRNLARQYGAGLIYVSSHDRESPSIARFYRWLCHECRGIPSQERRVTSPPSALYIPVGTDTRKALEQLCSEIGRGSLSTPLHTLIRAASSRQKSMEDTGVDSAQVTVPPGLNEFLARLAAENDKFVIAEEPGGEPDVSMERAPPMMPVGKEKEAKEVPEGSPPKVRETRRSIIAVEQEGRREREKTTTERRKSKEEREHREPREHRAAPKEKEVPRAAGGLKDFLLKDIKKKDAA